MRNPQPSISVSPPVCAGLELILKENAVVLHEKDKNMYSQSSKTKIKPLLHVCILSTTY